MQQQQVYTIHDSKGDAYSAPFHQFNEQLARRSFEAETMNPNSMISKFPEDFDLYHLGTFDIRTAKYELFDTPKHVVKATKVQAQN